MKLCGRPRRLASSFCFRPLAVRASMSSRRNSDALALLPRSGMSEDYEERRPDRKSGFEIISEGDSRQERSDAVGGGDVAAEAVGGFVAQGDDEEPLILRVWGGDEDGLGDQAADGGEGGGMGQAGE